MMNEKLDQTSGEIKAIVGQTTLYTTHPLFWLAVLIVIGILWGR